LLICTPVLTKIANKNNPGEFDAEHYWNYQGIHYQSYVPAYNYTVLVQEEKSLTSYFLAIRNKLAAIIDTYLTGQEAAVAKGLILGDRTSIEAETTRMFGNTGVMHILAVSGMHVAILVLILNYILQRFPKYITKKQAVIISLTLVWFYSLMTGFSASVARAAWMFTLISGSTLLERRYFPVNGLLFSALIILIINPFAIYDIGFQLSYAAMIGIYTFYPYLKNQLYFKNKWIRMTWEGIALSIAAQLITTPLAIYYFHQFPNYFLLTNIALSAYSLIILSLGLALFISNWWTLLGKGVGFILFWVMFSMLWIIQFIDALPQSVSEGFVLSGWVVFLLYGLIAGMHWSLLTKKIIPLATILTLALVVTAFVVVNRFNNMNAEHLIVFNDANMIVGFKNKERLCVIYDSKRVKKKQLDQLITAYRKIYPSSKCDTIAMHYQKKVSLSSKKHSFSINYSKGGYELNVQDKRFFLATNSRFTAAGREVILSPTIDDAVFRHQLKKGAFMFPLE
jgi:competence protein ComEC